MVRSSGFERDQLDNDDKFMLHLVQLVRNALGDRAGTCVDPKTQELDGGDSVRGELPEESGAGCFSGGRAWRGVVEGDFFVRSGPGTVKLPPESAGKYVETRFG